MTNSLSLAAGARRVPFSGAKGGVGTSTVAVVHALALARAGFPTTITAEDAADLSALLGVAPSDGTLVDVNALTALTASTHQTAYVVIDGGTKPPTDLDPDEHYLVTRACYLALRRSLAHPVANSGGRLTSPSLAHRSMLSMWGQRPSVREGGHPSLEGARREAPLR
jgi:hypothetical protein